MFLFPSIEWLKELQRILNASDEYRSAGKNWEGSLTLVSEPDETYDKHHYIWINPYHGQVLDVAEMNSVDEKPSPFILTGTYSTWKGIVKGEIDPIKGLMKGKITVDGNVSYLVTQVKQAQALLKGLMQVETRFADEEA